MSDHEKVWPGDVLPTADARERLHAFMDGRWSGNKRRSYRDAAREVGVHHATLWRFSSGGETMGSVLDAICVSLPHCSNLGSRRDPTGHEPRQGSKVGR